MNAPMAAMSVNWPGSECIAAEETSKLISVIAALCRARYFLEP
jgi:hypothetical protein